VFDKVISVNARGALLVIKYAARSLIRLGTGGSVVNVSSQASLVALAGHESYGSSKAALDNITRVSALELGRYGIRVNSVNPTVVMTPMSAWYRGRPHIEGPFLDQMPLGRWATEKDIAGPIVFLLSDDAAMISGVSLAIDGGYSIRLTHDRSGRLEGARVSACARTAAGPCSMPRNPGECHGRYGSRG